MKKILFALVALVALVGCGDTITQDKRTTVACGDGGCGDIAVDGSTVVTQASNSDYAESDPELATYDETYDVGECTDRGFFWCSIEQKCLNQSLSSGSCN